MLTLSVYDAGFNSGSNDFHRKDTELEPYGCPVFYQDHKEEWEQGYQDGWIAAETSVISRHAVAA